MAELASPVVPEDTDTVEEIVEMMHTRIGHVSDTIEEVVEMIHTKIGHASYAELLSILNNRIKPFLLGALEVLFYCCCCCL
jgi:hypothetical protein